MRTLVLCLVLGCNSCAALTAAAPVACKVINLANDACMLLTFTGADGTPHTVSCSKEELQAWGVKVESAHKMGVKYTP